MPDETVAVADPRGVLGRLLAWIRRRERPVLLTAVGFQLVVLIALIGLRLTPLLSGDSILVRVVPVDPRDLFRGDYVVLGYEFNRVPTAIEGLSGLDEPREQDWLGRTVYVILVPEPDGKHWRPETFSIHRPGGGKYLRGTLVSPGQLVFGIESYYVQEGQGRQYEQAILDRRLSAEIAVTADGQAALRGLLIE